MRMRRRVVLSLVAVLVLVGVGYTAWWYVLARRVESGFAVWEAARRAEGWTVTVGASRLTGWPAAAGIELTDLKLRGGAPELPASFSWDAAGLAIQVAPFNLGTLVLLPHGEQRIGFPGGPALALEGRSLRGQLPLDRSGPPWPLDVTAEAVRVHPAQGGADALLGRIAAHAELDPTAAAAASALVFTVEAGRIELPPGRPWPLGERIETISGEAAISGPVPPRGQPSARAERWRQAGGAAVLRHGTLHWGPLEASVTGRATLDKALQLVAGGSARVTGWAPALDVLAAHHVISDHAALTAKAVVSLLAETPAGGGPAILTIPFSARDGVLSIRQIPLVRLPALEWSGT